VERRKESEFENIINGYRYMIDILITLFQIIINYNLREKYFFKNINPI